MVDVDRTVVEVREDDGWRTVAVIDGRNYADRESFDRTVREAFATLSKHKIPAQFETRRVKPGEPTSRLPSWEDYRVTLASRGDRGTA
jgi:hypothetical protein